MFSVMKKIQNAVRCRVKESVSYARQEDAVFKKRVPPEGEPGGVVKRTEDRNVKQEVPWGSFPE